MAKIHGRNHGTSPIFRTNQRRFLDGRINDNQWMVDEFSGQGWLSEGSPCESWSHVRAGEAEISLRFCETCETIYDLTIGLIQHVDEL
jgi:hypothetical protein